VDQIRKWRTGDVAQPDSCPPSKVKGCSQFSVNECKKLCKSRLDTVTIRTNSSKTGKLKFLINTGAEISVVKASSINLGTNYDPTKEINIKGISESFLKTKGTTELTLFTPTHETTHVFHVVGSNFGSQYDGILGLNFWKLHRATIDYCSRIITMSDVTVSFDNETDRTLVETYKLTLKPRTENIVRLPTKSKGLGVIPKAEIMPGIYLAVSLTEEINGYCITSIVNTSGREISRSPLCRAGRDK